MEMYASTAGSERVVPSRLQFALCLIDTLVVAVLGTEMLVPSSQWHGDRIRFGGCGLPESCSCSASYRCSAEHEIDGSYMC